MDIIDQFISYFNDDFIIVNGLKFRVLEATIVESIRAPMEREKWFKNKPFHDVDLNMFLEPEFYDSLWSMGIPHTYLLGIWNDVPIVAR